MPTYAVTGATGPFGRRVVTNLLDRGVPGGDVVAVVRTPEKVADLAARGVEVRHGDYDLPETLTGAFAGVRRLLFVSGSEAGRRVPQHAAVVEAAREAEVERIWYTSVLYADTSTNPVAGEHKATEAAIKDSGLTYTLLRNSWYMEVYSGQVSQYTQTGVVLGAAGVGRVSAALRADYADAATSALSGDYGISTVYDLGGPGFTLSELAEAVTAITGVPVTYRDVPPDELVTTLRHGGLDEATAGFVAAIDRSIARGELETMPDTLTALLGRPPTPLVESLRILRPPATGS